MSLPVLKPLFKTVWYNIEKKSANLAIEYIDNLAIGVGVVFKKLYEFAHGCLGLQGVHFSQGLTVGVHIGFGGEVCEHVRLARTGRVGEEALGGVLQGQALGEAIPGSLQRAIGRETPRGRAP